MEYRVTWLSVLMVTLLLVIPSIYSISMSIDRKGQIFDLCYNRQRTTGQLTPLINGQVSPPLAASVENLIALIEKMENATTSRTILAKDLAATLLRKFRSDGNVVRAYSFLDQSEVYETIDKIEDILLESPAEVTLDDQTILTENERCSLYFMLSYHINQTEKSTSRSTGYSTVYRAPTTSTSSRTTGTPRYGNTQYAPVSLAVKPREYGVGSYRSNNDQAITLNRLLLGVIAGQLNSPGVSVRDVITRINPNIPQESLNANVDDLINPLMAVTLSNIHAMAAHAADETNTIGASGTWDSANTLCTTEYSLNLEKPSDATLANIRGGLDGYYIGELTKSLTKTTTGSRLRLSQILRYYYDNIGGRIAGTGYCDRPTISIDDRSFRDTATNYAKALELSKNYGIPENVITKSIESTRTGIDAAYTRAKAIPAEDSEWCSSGGLNTGYKAECETPTDLFVAIDLQSADAEKYKNLTARLINKLNLAAYGSSATILSMNREDNLGTDGQNFRNNLKHLAWASYNKGCTGCAMSYIREDTLGSVITAPSTDLYLRMNATLRDFEFTKWFQLGVPAKPFIVMGGSYTSRSIDANIRETRQALKRNHRDVPVFLVTNANENDLTEYISSPQDIIRDQEGLDVMTNELSQKICQVPATFQYPDCQRVSSEATSAFESFITPGRVQYWAMYPEYFIKSYDIVMKFYSSESDLKVCFSRQPKAEETGRCWEAKKNEEIRIDVSDPCKDRDVMTCDPFYFTISPPDQGMTSNTICSDKKCLNARQIKFRFSHSGIACSSAFTLVSSLSLALICALLSTILNPIKGQF